jgi:hypothetical protein
MSNIIVTHNNGSGATDISDLVLFKSLATDSKRNERVDTCSFTIEKEVGDTFVPELNAEVIVSLDGFVEFAGKVQKIDESVDGQTIVYKATCVDFTRDLDNMLIVERFEDTTVDAVIQYLIDTYAPDFTYTNVDAPIAVDSVAFNRIYITQCLKKLADAYNYNWYVDNNKDVHFFAKNAEPAPYSITDTSDKAVWQSLKITRDLSQLRNKILVEGGEVEGLERTVKYAGNDEQDTFDTQYKFATKPVVEVDGSPVLVGTDYLQEDDGFVAMWSFQQKYIRFTDGNIPSAPVSGNTNINIIGVPLFPIVVQVPSPASIGLYGERQFSIKDVTIKSQEQAIERAIAEIQAYAGTINEGSFTTYEQGLRSGQIITINSTLRGINEDFVIQSVKMKPFSHDDRYRAKYTVTLASVKTIGVIDVLQKLLLDEELELNEQETLLTFLQYQDDVEVSDSLTYPTKTTGPYNYGTAIVGFSTW